MGPPDEFSLFIIKKNVVALCTQDVVDSFTVPDCSDCGGLLKPFVVYFGDSVPRHRVSRVSDALRVSDAVLCVGTTLQVYSAYRWVVCLQLHLE